METVSLIIGLSAAFLTTFAFLPQAIKTIKTKHTKDLSLPMLVMVELGLICWLAYGLLINSTPVIAANTVSIVFISIILYMKFKYK
ncbi:MAG: SemiSWEET transporter [Chlorobi bacterium]|nr:SemiSWEET transporter [Chlorobiota bacterium]MCI0714710.1 SemiSWEET transporter [Chlorobiota bacterium]